MSILSMLAERSHSFFIQVNLNDVFSHTGGEAFQNDFVFNRFEAIAVNGMTTCDGYIFTGCSRPNDRRFFSASVPLIEYEGAPKVICSFMDDHFGSRILLIIPKIAQQIPRRFQGG